MVDTEKTQSLEWFGSKQQLEFILNDTEVNWFRETIKADSHFEWKINTFLNDFQ